MYARKNKYKNTHIIVDGMQFDSKRELNRYYFLRTLENSGEIKNLERQANFELIPKQKGERAVNYVADFTYTTIDNKFVVEDSKGFRTKDYIIKRKLMLYIHGIRVKEV